MSPSAIPPAEIIDPSPVQALKTKKQYASGDPSLAYVDEEAENPPTFTDPYEERAYLKHRLALAFRVFARNGLAEGVAGHITLRDPVDPTSFWVNPFGTHFSTIRDEDLVRVDHDGKVVEGGKNKRLNYGECILEQLVGLNADRSSCVRDPRGDPQSTPGRSLRCTLSHLVWPRDVCYRTNARHAHTRLLCVL